MQRTERGRVPHSVWIGAAVVLVVGAALAFPSVRAFGQDFLDLFRVQQVVALPIDTTHVSSQLGQAAPAIQELIKQSVKYEGGGQPQQVADASAASAAAGIAVRLPQGASPNTLMVYPAGKATLTVDANKAKALAAQLGVNDLGLPPDLQQATVTAQMSPVVIARFGACSAPGSGAGSENSSPVAPTQVEAAPDCTTFVQMASPVVTAPQGVNLNALAEQALLLAGVSPDQAARLSTQIDWTSTLVVPIPVNAASYQEARVDGTSGLLISSLPQSSQTAVTQSALLWVKNGVVYALSGPQPADGLLQMADSLH